MFKGYARRRGTLLISNVFLHFARSFVKVFKGLMKAFFKKFPYRLIADLKYTLIFR